VTTLRQDVETDGRRAKVVFGRDWRQDAQRRDFTINALFASRDGKLHDYVGGLADLEARRVRFIGDPATRIAEDYLRVLRFFRFHASYAEGPLDPGGLAACIRARTQIETLSRERVRMELMKLLNASAAAPTCEAMLEACRWSRVCGAWWRSRLPLVLRPMPAAGSAHWASASLKTPNGFHNDYG
jgi:tRNA nucleotidyltransferase/poly(A) polymerase